MNRPELTEPSSKDQLSEVLSEFARTMLTDFPIQGILDRLVRRTVEIMPITGAGVTLISEKSRPRYVAASDKGALLFEQIQSQLDEGPCLMAFKTGESVAIPDLTAELRFPRFVPSALEAGLAAAFTFPLHHGDSPLGALDLYRDSPGPLSDHDMGVAGTLADVASAYLVNAQARSDLLDSSDRASMVALHDALTGLPNRVLLLERIAHALRVRRRSGQPLAVLFIDLDNFKEVNDTSGHQVGDDLLIAVSSRLTTMLRPGDTVARLSGDEFVVLCEDLSQEEQIDCLARRLVNAIGSPFDLDGAPVTLSASIGIAFAREESEPEQLLHKADVAMYQVKRRGGAGHQLIDSQQESLTDATNALRRDLGHAVQRNELRLEYQPLVRTSDGRVVGVEALLRWDHPDFGLISPATFIPMAEQSGNIFEIGRWVLEHACVDRHRWESRTGDETLVMAVNVSAHQLMAPRFMATVTNILSLTDTEPKEVCMEITESAFLQDAKRAASVLSELRAIGVQLALDDFGTGFSSLTYLMNFPVDIVKIDQTFIANLIESRASRAIVAATIDLCHVLGLTVLCEGVETVEQHREVAELSSDLCQGFYFSRPMTADTLDEMATSSKSAWTISA